MKLKTLKDLEILRRGRRREDTDTTEFYDVLQVGEYQNMCYPLQLKEEAIKWIKELESEKNRTEWTFLPNFYKFDEESIIFWIKHFFNISEEI